MKNIIAIILAVIAIAFSAYTYLNSPKIRYIDSSVMLEKYNGAIKAREDFETKSNAWTENIQVLETELNKMNEEIVADGSKWGKKKLADKKKDLDKKGREYAKYRRAIEDKASKLENDLMQPVYDELNSLLEEFGEKKGYDIIFGTVSGGNILHANRKVDITTDFIKYANSRF